MLLEDRVIIEPYYGISSAVIHDRTQHDMYRQGIVLQTGVDIDEVRTGDMVLFGLYAGIDIDGKRMIRGSDIMAIIDKWI